MKVVLVVSELSFTYNRVVHEFTTHNKIKLKTILHIDGDAFFVGVEVAKNSKLKGLPVVTGEERGIVSALSYEAKALGVVRGMPIFRVKKSFPQVIILPGDYASYITYSRMMFDIVRRYADDVEEYSIDECFADLTGLEPPLKMTYLQIAERIKREVHAELGLSVSIGLGPTKVLAKVASKWVKPNGLTVITPDSVRSFLDTTSIGKIWGIGPRTTELLYKKGIHTAGDFVAKNIEWVRDVLPKPYEDIWHELNCVSIMKLDPQQKTVYSSIQKTRSFYPTTNDAHFLFSQISKHIEDACAKARHFKLVPKKFSIFLKTKDFEYVVSSMSLDSPTHAPEIIISLAYSRFLDIYKKNCMYRTTGITLHDLVSSSSSQNDLFGNTDKTRKLELIHENIDALENRFGKRIVYLGSSHTALSQKTVGTDGEDLDRNLLFL